MGLQGETSPSIWPAPPTSPAALRTGAWLGVNVVVESLRRGGALERDGFAALEGVLAAAPGVCAALAG